MSRLRAERIVGIGASAGGLPALERLFAALRERDTGAAFVVVQHLDASHRTGAPATLGRVSGLKVVEAEHGADAEPNRVYTAPPDSYLAIEQGRFVRCEAPARHDPRKPIDHFMRTLADDRGASAVGIVLSGTGSDGTQGLRAIKGAGGTALVQDPNDAEFDDMPRSAIETGIADSVGDVEAIVQHLQTVLRGPADAVAKGNALAADGFDKVATLLAGLTGHRIRDDGRIMLMRRIRQRMAIHGLSQLEAYLSFLEADEAERHALALDDGGEASPATREGGGELMQRRPGDTLRPPVQEPAGSGGDPVVRAMLSRFAPPAVLVSERFEILRVHGEVGAFLNFRRGDLTSSFIEMVDEAYRTAVWTVLHTARRRNAEAELTAASATPGGPPVRIVAEPVDRDGCRGFLVYFLAGRATAADAEREGETAQRRQGQDPEAGAAFDASREALQTLNEELVAINAELGDRVADLEAANDDLSNLFRSTDIATVFLDTGLCIRRYTSRALDLFRLRETDIGRPLDDITRTVDDPGLARDIRDVMQGLERIEAEVRGEAGVFLRRITPYRTRSDGIEGVVITYADVTRLRVAAEALVVQSSRQQSIVRLGELALGSEDVDALFARAVQELRDCLGADLIGVFRHEADRFDLEAGAGWARGLVGWTHVPDSLRNELGFVLRRAGAATFTDIASDKRIEMTDMLRDAGAVGGVSITIGPLVEPWGVLSAWWRKPGEPDDAAVAYATSVASILWLAIAQAETKRLRDTRRQELQGLIDGLPILIGAIGNGMRFELCNHAFEALGWMPDELGGVHVADVLGPDVAEATARLVNGKSRIGAGAEIEIQVPGEGPRTHLLYCVPRGDRPDDGIFLAALDISERKRWEERNRVISAELDHRVKNILALVNTIARMTGRNAETIESFRDVFSQRIDSLARTHVRLASRNWAGCSLRELIEEELAAYATRGAERCTLEGPEIALGTDATQSFALALHELTTNAAKHGALSRNTGRLEVRWSVEAGRLVIVWSEHGVEGLTKPDRQGFGTTVVQNAVIRQLEGELDKTFSADGIVYRIAIPLGNIA